MRRLVFPITPRNVTRIAELTVLPGHRGDVRSQAFSPDGDWLALGVSDPVNNTTFVELYDGSAQLTGTIQTGWNGAESLVFHPVSGSLIVTSGNAPSITIWDPATRMQLRDVTVPVGHQPGTVAVTSSGNTVITGGFDGQVFIWDWNAGNPGLRKTFLAHASQPGTGAPYIESMAFSSDRQALATGVIASGFKIWRTTFDETPEEQTGSIAQAGVVTALQFDAAATRLAAACSDGRLRLVEIPSGRLIGALSEPPGVVGEQMFFCAYSQQAALMASTQSSAANAGALLLFWSGSDGAKLHELPVLCDRVAFSPDATRLLVVRNSPGQADIPTLWGIPPRGFPGPRPFP